MLAVAIDASGVLVPIRAAIPTAGIGQIAVDVSHAGVRPIDRPARSWVPGVEVTGHVRAVGPDVMGIAIGEPVIALAPDGGGYADIVVTNAGWVAALPDGGCDSPELGATAVDTTTAILVIDVLAVQPGDHVRILGAGPVTCQVEQVAAQAGAAVTSEPGGGRTRPVVVARTGRGRERTAVLGNVAPTGATAVDALSWARERPGAVATALHRAAVAVTSGTVHVPVVDVVRLDRAAETHHRLARITGPERLVLSTTA